MKLTRAQQYALVLTLLAAVVGITTNIATGQLPHWLAPYLWLSWPALAMLVLFWVVVSVCHARYNAPVGDPLLPTRRLVIWICLGISVPVLGILLATLLIPRSQEQPFDSPKSDGSTRAEDLAKTAYPRRLEELEQRLIGELRVVLDRFSAILEQERLPQQELHTQLRALTTRLEPLQKQLDQLSIDDPSVVAMKREVRTALETSAEILSGDQDKMRAELPLVREEIQGTKQRPPRPPRTEKTTPSEVAQPTELPPGVLRLFLITPLSSAAVAFFCGHYEKLLCCGKLATGQPYSVI
jgi:hypothetical protein